MLLIGYLYGIKSGEIGVADGSFLPSNVSLDSRYEAVETVQHSTVKIYSRTFVHAWL
ncbi:MAG: hypothetical protein ACOX8H_02260 [Ruminococcus sp.]|jgi:hypothetical protein